MLVCGGDGAISELRWAPLCAPTSVTVSFWKGDPYLLEIPGFLGAIEACTGREKTKEALASASLNSSGIPPKKAKTKGTPGNM